VLCYAVLCCAVLCYSSTCLSKNHDHTQFLCKQRQNVVIDVAYKRVIYYSAYDRYLFVQCNGNCEQCSRNRFTERLFCWIEFCSRRHPQISIQTQWPNNSKSKSNCSRELSNVPMHDKKVRQCKWFIHNTLKNAWKMNLNFSEYILDFDSIKLIIRECKWMFDQNQDYILIFLNVISDQILIDLSREVSAVDAYSWIWYETLVALPINSADCLYFHHFSDDAEENPYIHRTNIIVKYILIDAGWISINKNSR
jgi:hypothetical protein